VTPSRHNPSAAAPGKARAPVSPRTVTSRVDTPATSAATGRSAGSKRDKIEQAEDGDERSEESAAHKTRRVQRAADATKGDDDDARSSRKRGLEKIERMLEAMHRMRPNSLRAGDERAERGAAPSHPARTALRSAQHEIFAAVAPSPLFLTETTCSPARCNSARKQRFTRFIKAEHDNATDRKTPFHICEESFQGVIILISHGSL
jgi:hypothetical protein